MSLDEAMQFVHSYNILKSEAHQYIQKTNKPKKSKAFEPLKKHQAIQKTPSLSFLLNSLQQQEQSQYQLDKQYSIYSRSPQSHFQATNKSPKKYQFSLGKKFQSSPTRSELASKTNSYNKVKDIQFIKEAAKTNKYIWEMYNYQTNK